jgi:SAM-dependent methyltransferase
MFAPALDDTIQCQVCGNDAVDPAGEAAGAELYRCRWCEFVFAAAAPDGRPALATRGFARQRPEQITPALSYLGEHELRVLCIGDAPARLSAYLQERGHRVSTLVVDGTDVDALAALDLPDDVFDLVCITGIVQALTSPVPVIDELLRLTRPGGLVVVQADLQPPAAYSDDDRPSPYGSDGRAFYTHRTFEVLVEDTPHRVVVRDARLVGILKRAPQRRLTTETTSHLALV